MKGTFNNPIQIDKAGSAGQRKYNRGRLLASDEPPGSKDENADVENNRNHGARVNGPWKKAVVTLSFLVVTNIH